MTGEIDITLKAIDLSTERSERLLDENVIERTSELREDQ